VDQEQKLYYAGLIVLKKMDLKPEDGGMIFPVLLPPELEPLEDVLQELVNQDLVAINPKKHRYELTKKGLAYIGEHIDEAEALVDELEEYELEQAIEILRERNLDVFRARFLWGWYDGELDDLVLFQQRRGITPAERLWAFYLMGNAFWETLETDTRA
jgi:hypothetical protein